MPLKSKSQYRALLALEAKGEVPKGTAKKWLKHTPGGLESLPEAKMHAYTPGQLKAAMEFERARGSGSEEEQAKRVQEHLAERPEYYSELARMMNPDHAPLFRSMTPADLKKAEGGWETGPKGGVRKKGPDGKWIYRGEEGEGGGKAAAKDDKKPSKGAKGGDEEQKPGKGGGPEEEKQEAAGAHPDAPSDSHQTTEGKSLEEVIKHLDQYEPDELEERGKKIVEAIKKKNPEKAKDVAVAMAHLVDAHRISRAHREAGKSSKKEDMTAQDALKKIMRDFNASAAPASVLGPEFGGVLKEDKEAGTHGESEIYKQALDKKKKAMEALEGDFDPTSKEAQQAKAQVEGKKPPPGKAEKSYKLVVTLAKAAGPYGRAGMVPMTPQAGATSTAPTPALPDYGEIYYIPKDDPRRKLEHEQEVTRRKANSQRNSARFGFHGEPTDPVVRYESEDEPHLANVKIARSPKLVARTQKQRMYAGKDVEVDEEEEEEKKRKKKYAKSFLIKAGKYIKRVPYMKDGKKRYRYYYRESAAAREAQEGEEVQLGKRRLKVDKIHEDGSLSISLGGETRKISRDQYTQLLARHFGSQYFAHAEKRAKQALNAVYRHVPKTLLQELQGNTFEERLQDLRKRAPKVYMRLEKSFERAGVSPERAKRIVAKSLQARGWSEDARAVVLGSVILKRTRAESFHEVLSGAENLAGGNAVEMKHAAAAVGLREGDFPSQVAAVAKRAEAELAKLTKLLASSGDDKAEALAEALSSSAIAKLNLLTQAFPGLKDRVADEARSKLLEVPSQLSGPPKTAGAESVVFVAGEGGAPKALKARYRLVEASEIKASHDPTKSFAKRSDYPEGVQERVYHQDKSEQMKVIRNAQKLRPAFMVNTNPDAVNGPPILTEQGVALGGNSRTMSIQLAYHQHPEKAQAYRDYLEKQAHQVGLRPEDVQAMKQPVLVREVISDGAKHSREDMQLMVRQMNESFTQGMDPRAMQVAMGRKLDKEILSDLANSMEDGESLSQFLSSKRSDGFVKQLSRVGIIDARNSNQYKDKTGRLNADGRTLVARILVGRLVNDTDTLSNTQPRTIESIARATPHMMSATAHGAGFDLGSDMATALRDLNELRRRQADGTISGIDANMKQSDFEGFFAQQSLFAGDAESDIDLESANNQKSRLLLWALIKRPGSQQLSSLFKDYAATAAKHPEAQIGLLGLGEASLSPLEVLQSVVDQHIGSKK